MRFDPAGILYNSSNLIETKIAQISFITMKKSWIMNSSATNRQMSVPVHWAAASMNEQISIPNHHQHQHHQHIISSEANI